MELIKLFDNLIRYGLESLGLYYSEYMAFVYDNNDPENMNRLKLIIPIVGGSENPVNVWAFSSGQFSGKNYGVQVLPSKGDFVWVSFENGNRNVPVWRHGHFGQDEKPGEFQNPTNYAFKTPSGHLVELDDTNGSNEIRITHSSGDSTIKFGSTGIEVTSKLNNVDIYAGNNQVSLDDSGINIDAGGNPIFVGGGYQVLYAKIPQSTDIVDVSEIGVSQVVKIG